MANLSSETAAYTLRISQSLIGRTRSEIMQDRGNGIIHTFCSSGGQSHTDASIVFFISKGISFGCYFPTDDECKLVNIPLTQNEVEVYRNYCNSQYEVHETADDSWYNSDLKTFIRIFFDADKNSYMLSIMDMTDDLLNESDGNGVN